MSWLGGRCTVRVLATQAEAAVPAEPRSHVGPDGRLDVRALLEGFAQFWREHGEVVAGRIDYPEVAPQLVLMAWLHRIVNGGGTVQREVGVGRMRIDLVVRWPFVDGEGQRTVQRAAMELKVWRDRDKKGDPLGPGPAAARRVPRSARARRGRAGDLRLPQHGRADR